MKISLIWIILGIIIIMTGWHLKDAEILPIHHIDNCSEFYEESSSSDQDNSCLLRRYHILKLLHEKTPNDAIINSMLALISGEVGDTKTSTDILLLVPDGCNSAEVGGYYAMQFSNYDRAKMLFGMATSACPKQVRSWFGMAFLEFKLINYDRSIYYATQALDIDQNYGDAWLLLGEAYFSDGNPTKAVEAFRRAVFFTKKLEAYLGLAEALSKIDPLSDEVALLFQHVLQIDSHNENASLGLAEWYRASGELLMAKKLYESVLSDNPESQFGLRGLGIIFYEEGAYELANRYFRRSIELYPKDAHAHYWLGKTLVHLGLYCEAQIEYNDAISIEPLNQGFRHDMEDLKNSYPIPCINTH